MAGARKLLESLALVVPRLKKMWADAAYRGEELAQFRLFPVVDTIQSGTRHEELLLTPEKRRGATTPRPLLADQPVQVATSWCFDAMECPPSMAMPVNSIAAEALPCREFRDASRS